MSKIVNFDEAKKRKDDLIPMEEWDGSCWKTMFDTLAEMFPQNDPWDNLAAFIKGALMNDKE